MATKSKTVSSTSTTKETKTRIVPAGTMSALEIAMPKEIISGTAFFDPIDLLEDKLGHQPNLHSRVLESMTWMIDTLCINQARTVLFGRYTEQDTEHNDPLSFEDFCQCVADDIAHPSLYKVEGNESTLAILLALRNHWHDAAESATNADDRDYKPKSLREQMEAEKVKAPDLGTRVNYKKIAELEANGDEAKAARLYEDYMEADKLRTTDRVENNKHLMPVIIEILRAANMHAVESSRFDELPELKQKQLTAFAVGAIDRSRIDLARRLSKQPIAFGHMAEAARDAVAAINKVLKDKYSDVGELENIRSQVSINHERNQKRVALID